jgi:hypothetical protein
MIIIWFHVIIKVKKVKYSANNEKKKSNKSLIKQNERNVPCSTYKIQFLVIQVELSNKYLLRVYF